MLKYVIIFIRGEEATMIDDLIWECFGRFKLYKNNKEIIFNNLEKRLLNYIDLQHGNNIFVTAKDDEYLLILNIIYNALKISYYNLFQSEVDILDVIKNGEILQYNNKALCCYEGKEKNLLILRFRDGRIFLPVSSRYKLSKYNGDATILSKMPTKKVKNTKKTKKILAEIMDINVDEICKETKKSILIISNKQKIDEIIKSIEIKVGENERISLTEIFPMAYYSSIENVTYYKGNSKKQDPIIKFTSKTYIADDICKKIKSINSVLFLPRRLVLDDLIDLKEIEKKDNISKITSIVFPIDIEREIDNKYIHDDFNIKSIDINVNDIEINEFNQKQYKYYKNYTQNNIEIIDINEKDINDIRTKINRISFRLSKLFNEDDEIIKFIINSRKVTKRILTLPIPLKEFDNIIRKKYPEDTLEYLLDNLKYIYNSILERNLSNNVRCTVQSIYDSVLSLYNIIKEKNRKWDRLKSIIIKSNSDKILIVSDNRKIRYSIREYFKTIFPYKYNLVVNKINNKKDSLFDKTIFLGLLEDNLYNNYKRYDAKNIMCIFYKFERLHYEYIRNKYYNFIKSALIVDNVSKEEYSLKNKPYINETIDKEIDLEVKLEELLITSFIPSNSCKKYNQTMNLCSRVLKFTDGRKAFITPRLNVYKLDENKEEIVVIKPEEIVIGNVLLFIDDIEKDIIELVIKDLLNIKEIKDLYKEAYYQSKEWKSVLKSYMEVNNYTYDDLKNKLKQYGISRTGATIRSWVVDSIVGPQEEDVFKAIAEVTGDKYLIDNYKKIYGSCNIIRGLQVKVRKAIAKNLLRINSKGEDDEIDNIIMNSCSGKFSYINKVEVSKVYEINKEIPNYMTNIVLEE